MIDEVLSSAHAKMQKAIDALGRELASIRTGHATPALVEHIRVDYYGASTPLHQLAIISAPEARLLVIQPWDRNAIASIEKAILKSDLGVNPSSDGDVIRLAIPPLSEERRRDLVKMIGRRVEEGKVTVRNLRRETMEEIRDLEKKKEISHDELKRALGQLQKITDSFIIQAEQVEEDRAKEVMEF
jgi:ribosome recycling factor